jgi:uncharacterized membrane protein
MDLLYRSIEFIHHLLTIVAVGLNISYNLWISRAERDPAHLPFALRGIKFLDDRVANPAYILLMVTGIALVLIGRLPMTAFWLWFSSVLWVVIMIVAYALYTPLLRQQIAVLEARGADTDEYRSAARRVRLLGQALALMVVAILILMIFKPTF